MLHYDIENILNKNGYNTDKVEDCSLNELQDNFEVDMENFLREYVEEHSYEIAFEYASRLGLSKEVK